VILHIGTNNTSQTANARKNSATEIIEGVKAVCMRVRSKVPTVKIILMAVFPREQSPTNPRRLLINEVNDLLRTFAKENNICLVDLGSKMLSSDGTLSTQICDDFCHPTEKGYQIWADAIRSEIGDY
jgi:lysophospholipase L1-like esterase